jgi:hypothetical protein
MIAAIILAAAFFGCNKGRDRHDPVSLLAVDARTLTVLDLIIIAALAKLSERGRWISASAIVIGVVIWIGAGAAMFGTGLFSATFGFHVLGAGRDRKRHTVLQRDKARRLIFGGVGWIAAGAALVLASIFYIRYFGDADPLPGFMKFDDG